MSTLSIADAVGQASTPLKRKNMDVKDAIATMDDEAAPTTQPPERFGSFELNDDGVFRISLDKTGKVESLWKICAPLKVKAMTRDRHSTNWGMQVEFRDRDGITHRCCIPYEQLQEDTFISTLASQGLDIEPTRTARQDLASYLSKATTTARARCVDSTGWNQGVFVLPDRVIGSTTEEVVLQTGSVPPEGFAVTGTAESWRDHVARLCQKNSRLLLAVCVSLAPPTLHLLEEESGGINLVGPSSFGKTTALHVAASAWGNRDFVKSWRGTANGHEAVARSRCDCLLPLDELSMVSPLEAGETAYCLANGTVKSRAQKNGDARVAAIWRILFLSSGEIGLSERMAEAGRKSRAGQEVRLVDVPADAGAGHGLFEDVHGYANGSDFADALKQACAANHGTAAPAFVATLCEDKPQVILKLRKIMDDFCTKNVPEESSGQVRRVAKRFALVAACGELATEFGLTGWSTGEAVAGVAKCFAAWLAERPGTGQLEDAKIIEQMTSFIETHGSSRFSEVNEDRAVGNRAGFKRSVKGSWHYFISSHVFKSEICQGLNATHAAKVLKEEGLLAFGKDGATKNVRFPGVGQRRMYHVILPKGPEEVPENGPGEDQIDDGLD